jgi:acyl transferase domain-containing protein
LAQLFVQSCDLDWAELYQAEDHRRLSLPTYPFAREYYYPPTSTSKTSAGTSDVAEKLHPLLARNVSTLREAKFTTRLAGNEFFLTDHVIFGQKILPGSAYLEMARAAAARAGERTVKNLKDIFFAQPISLAHNADPIDVAVILNRNEDQLDFEVVSFNVDAADAIHARGTVVFASRDRERPQVEFIDLERILDRCERSLDREEFYRLFERFGVEYGPSFRAIEQLSFNKTEGLARIELPAALSRDFSEFVLHPSLLDAALQTIATFRDDAETDSAYLPIAIGQISIVDELPEMCYAHIVRSNDTRSSRSSLKAFNILIVDETGRVRVEIKDFAVKAFSSATKQDAAEAAERHDAAELLNILQEIERGNLNVEAAEKFLDEIYA